MASKNETNLNDVMMKEISIQVKDVIHQEMQKKWEEFTTRQFSPSYMTHTCSDLFAALSKAQSQIEHAKKDKTNPYFKSSYADLASVWRSCKDALSENNLCVVQTFKYEEGAMFIVTTLGHSSGQWIKSETIVPTGKGDPQSIGSAITYFRRYALSAIVGITPDEDDDGNAAQGLGKQQIETISNDQVKEIQTMLKGNDKLMNTLISHLNRTQNIMQLSQIPTTMFPKVKTWLKNEINKNASSEENVA